MRLLRVPKAETDILNIVETNSGESMTNIARKVYSFLFGFILVESVQNNSKAKVKNSIKCGNMDIHIIMMAYCKN